MQEHGKWDNGLMRFLYEVESVNAEEQMTRDESLAAYEQAKQNIVERGFIYAFSPDCGRKVARAEQQAPAELATA
jgi:hypothetical protein